MRRRTTTLLAGAAFLIAFPGGAYLLNPDRGNPYAGELAKARASATAFQREVLYDSAITDDELTEARRLWRECLYDNGLSPARAENNPDGPVAAGCRETTVGDLDSLQHAMITDPEKKGFTVVLAECLERKGLVPDGYDPADASFDLVQDTIGRLGTENPGLRACLENPSAA